MPGPMSAPNGNRIPAKEGRAAITGKTSHRGTRPAFRKPPTKLTKGLRRSLRKVGAQNQAEALEQAALVGITGKAEDVLRQLR